MHGVNGNFRPGIGKHCRVIKNTVTGERLRTGEVAERLGISLAYLNRQLRKHDVNKTDWKNLEYENDATRNGYPC